MDYFNTSLRAALSLIFAFDADTYYVVWTSVVISLSAVAIAAAFALPLGIVVAMREFAGKRFLQQCLNTLSALPTVVVGLFFYGLLSRQGPLGEHGLLYTRSAIIIGESALILPIIWNLCIAAVQSADPRLQTACLALGADPWQQAFIVIGEVRFALVAALVMGFGRAIGEVGAAMMLGGNISGYTRTMTTAIALETSKGEFELALALGILLLAIAFGVNLLFQRIQNG